MMAKRLIFLIITVELCFLTACQEDDMYDKDLFYRTLSDHVQEVCITNPESNFAYIDSLEDNNVITPEIGDYFRANTHYVLNNLRAVEYYNKRALNGNELYNEWRRAYYVASRNLANNLNWKGDYEGSLEYATRAYEKTIDDTAFVAKLNAPGLLLQIALCQKSLGNNTESYKNFERSYQQDCNMVMNDTSFNTHYYFFQNTLAVVARMDSLTSKSMVELWICRSEDAAAQLFNAGQLHPLGVVDQDLLERAIAQLNVSKARIQMLLGQTDEAEKNYQKFLESAYANSIAGILSQYNYMRTAKQWDKAAALIPKVDSAKAIRGEYYSLEYLINLNQQRQTLEKAGLHQQAMKKTETLLASIDTVVKMQQQSEASELAVVFETAEKERKIVEQEQKIEHQWALLIGIPLVLISIFLIFFNLHRQKELKRIASGHRKLKETYYSISHDIRTPLNALGGFVQILTSEDYELDEQTRQDAAKHILENTRRINDVVSKMQELGEAPTSA